MVGSIHVVMTGLSVQDVGDVLYNYHIGNHLALKLSWYLGLKLLIARVCNEKTLKIVKYITTMIDIKFIEIRI